MTYKYCIYAIYMEDGSWDMVNSSSHELRYLLFPPKASIKSGTAKQCCVESQDSNSITAQTGPEETAELSTS